LPSNSTTRLPLDRTVWAAMVFQQAGFAAAGFACGEQVAVDDADVHGLAEFVDAHVNGIEHRQGWLGRYAPVRAAGPVMSGLSFCRGGRKGPRLDIKRPQALTRTITSPLLDMIKSGAPATGQDSAGIPAALDLPQVPASEVIPVKPTPLRRPDTTTTRTPAAASPSTPASGVPNDIQDWI
jgi:hypothetical protein